MYLDVLLFDVQLCVQVQQEMVVATNELNRKHRSNERNESCLCIPCLAYIGAHVYMCVFHVYIALNVVAIVDAIHTAGCLHVCTISFQDDFKGT